MSIYNTPFIYIYIVQSGIKYLYHKNMEDDEIYRRIGLNVHIERKLKGLTQEKLAELIDVHEKYIGRIETGKQNVTIKTLNKIANVLGIKITRLLEDKNYRT